MLGSLAPTLFHGARVGLDTSFVESPLFDEKNLICYSVLALKGCNLMVEWGTFEKKLISPQGKLACCPFLTVLLKMDPSCISCTPWQNPFEKHALVLENKTFAHKVSHACLHSMLDAKEEKQDELHLLSQHGYMGKHANAFTLTHITHMHFLICKNQQKLSIHTLHSCWPWNITSSSCPSWRCNLLLCSCVAKS